MSVNVGDHLRKLATKYDPDTGKPTAAVELLEGPAAMEFEVLDLVGCNQSDPDGFRPRIRLVPTTPAPKAVAAPVAKKTAKKRKATKR